jgi:uridine kinase
LARRLYEELGEAEHVCYLFHDSYYKDISHKTFEERSQTNFDHPDSLDTDLLLQHLKELKAGAACNIPTYDFTTHSRNASSLGMEAKKIIIVEGILLFTHPELTQEMDVKVFVVGLQSDGTGHGGRSLFPILTRLLS